MNEDDYSPSKAILLFKHRTGLKFILKSQLLCQAKFGVICTLSFSRMQISCRAEDLYSALKSIHNILYTI